MAESNVLAYLDLRVLTEARRGHIRVEQDIPVDIFSRSRRGDVVYVSRALGHSAVDVRVTDSPHKSPPQRQLQIMTELHWIQPKTGRMAEEPHATYAMYKLGEWGARQLDVLAGVFEEHDKRTAGMAPNSLELLDADVELGIRAGSLSFDGITRAFRQVPHATMRSGGGLRQSLHEATIDQARLQYPHLSMLSVQNHTAPRARALPYLLRYLTTPPPRQQ